VIGLDTNIVVRYFAQDDPKQSSAASRLIESFTPKHPGLVPAIVVAETVWVMEESYDADRVQIASIVENLLRTESLMVEGAETAWKALSRYRNGTADFSDCLIAQTCADRGCSETYTFDKRAARDAGMTLVKA
jgi:predicted nucleic-acid-binding protein